MKRESLSVNNLQSLFNEYEERMKVFFKEEIRNAIREVLSEKLPTDTILKIKQELKADGNLLDDLITIPSSASLETIAEKYW